MHFVATSVVAGALLSASFAHAKSGKLSLGPDKTKEDKVYFLNDAEDVRDVDYQMTCSPPSNLGGKGYCGPSYCDSATKWSCTGSGKCAVCQYDTGFNQMGYAYDVSKKYDYQATLDTIGSYKCKQSTDHRCTSEALTDLIKAQGIKAAYCNDKFLVVHTDMTPGYPTHLSDIPMPPGGGEDHDVTYQDSISGEHCQTGEESVYEAYGRYKFPLETTLLDTSTYRNNLNRAAFPSGPSRNMAGGYMSWTVGLGHDYGFATRGPTALTITGQEIFPMFNNIGFMEPQKCEVDTCNQHIGAGGGPTHIHGDPFGGWCMYDIDNYTSPYAHPPQIGWVHDGLGTYGRHVGASNLGFGTALDKCGGHEHDDLGYHYHAQMVQAVTDEGRYNPPNPYYDEVTKAGIRYVATTTGPYQCMKGDISLIPNYWSGWKSEKVKSNIALSPDTTYDMCFGTTEYYAAAGYSLPIAKSAADYVEVQKGVIKAQKASQEWQDQVQVVVDAQEAEEQAAAKKANREGEASGDFQTADKIVIANILADAAAATAAKSKDEVKSEVTALISEGSDATAAVKVIKSEALAAKKEIKSTIKSQKVVLENGRSGHDNEDTKDSKDYEKDVKAAIEDEKAQLKDIPAQIKVAKKTAKTVEKETKSSAKSSASASTSASASKTATASKTSETATTKASAAKDSTKDSTKESAKASTSKAASSSSKSATKATKAV